LRFGQVETTGVVDGSKAREEKLGHRIVSASPFGYRAVPLDILTVASGCSLGL
jgi:hypothetical protein